MNELAQFVVFRLAGQRFALPLDVIERIVRAVEVTPLPKAPPGVLGAIDVGGSILPVLDVCRRFQLAKREISPDDQFVIAQVARRKVVLAVGEAEGVIERPTSDIVDSTQIAPGLDQIQGVIKLDDGLAVIHDLEKFLSLDEARTLDEAMNTKAAHEK